MSPEINAGDTAWMLAATALVLLMTPALGLFYAGLVRSKNTLNTFMMCVAALAVATAMAARHIMNVLSVFLDRTRPA